MKDLRNLSNPIGLALVLLAVCTVSTFVMGLTAAKTAAPIQTAMEKDTADILNAVLPDHDNNPAADFTEIKFRNGDEGKLFIARKDGQIVGYALGSEHPGYGGPVHGITGFKPDGTILMVMIQPGHSETPGIGTRVTNREVRRTIGDILHGRQNDTAIPPNPALDSYTGKTAASAENWSIRKINAPDSKPGPNEVDFVSGATYSSTAVYNLVKDAANAVADYLAAGNKEEDQ